MKRIFSVTTELESFSRRAVAATSAANPRRTSSSNVVSLGDTFSAPAGYDNRGDCLQDLDYLSGNMGVPGHVGTQIDRIRASTVDLGNGYRRVGTECPGPVIGRRYHTVVAGQGADHHGAVAVFGLVTLFDAGIEDIEISMSDPTLYLSRVSHYNQRLDE